MTGRRTVLLTVSVDTECDKGVDWKTQFPLQFKSVTEGIPRVLMPLLARYGAVPTLLLSPEILRDDSSVAALREIGNCELGTHLHGEFVEPEADFGAEATHTPQSAYSPSVEKAKLRNLTDLFEARFGRRPRSFRGGRFALSSYTLGFLEELGYAVDSSVTPFRTNEYDGGRRCNYWGAPLEPYHPSSTDPRKKGSLRLLEVPVTILAPSFARWPAFLLRRMGDQVLRRRRLLKLLGLKAEKLWIRPFRGNGSELAAWSDRIIEGWSAKTPPIINVMFHSVELVPGASPYARDEGEVARLREGLDALLAHLSERYSVESMGLSDLPARLTH